jgi:two-component system response regulator
MTTILHVEDDPLLAETVKAVFEGLGFSGTYVIAMTVEHANRVLARDSAEVDLILSDMHLPDGSGLDVVRAVRASPTRALVPIVILSGDTDASQVDYAYVLGANAYVGKTAPGRSVMETMSALYAHWLKDARLPSSTGVTRTYQYLMRGIRLRTRKAAIELQIAEQLGPSLGGFWMDLALREGNLANLLAFLAGQLGDRQLPPRLLDDAEAVQQELGRILDAIEREPVRTIDDAKRYMKAIVSNLRVSVRDRALAHLFPNRSMAMAALRDVAASAVEEMASWIESHISEPALRGQIPQLRADAARIRA